MAEIRTIIVPCDGSEHTANAAQHAALLARVTRLPVHLVHVSPSTPVDLLGMPYPSPEMVGVEHTAEESFKAMTDKAAEKSFDVARQALGQDIEEVEAVRLKGDPSEQIIEYAQGQPDPLIIIGRRGLGRFRAALLGSVSQRVLNWARCPVMVVN